MSSFGSSRSEESCSAVLELLERVTRLHKQLELKESQAEINMDQVQANSVILWCHLPSVGSISMKGSVIDIVLLAFNPKPFCGSALCETRLEMTAKCSSESGGLHRLNHS